MREGIGRGVAPPDIDYASRHNLLGEDPRRGGAHSWQAVWRHRGAPNRTLASQS